MVALCCGIAIGVLSWFTLLISQKPLGCSTTFARDCRDDREGAAGTESPFSGPTIRWKTKPTIDWQWMLVLGVVIGSFISSVSARSRMGLSRWALAFGDAAVPRLVAALVGGVLLGLVKADGCTSGHGISGTMQLAVSADFRHLLLHRRDRYGSC